MANTFKVVTKANVTSADVIYTVASSTTTVVLGIMVGNTTTGQITATVSLASDTSSRAGANNEANQTVELVTNAPIPVGGTLELLSGNKVVMETTDTIAGIASTQTLTNKSIDSDNNTITNIVNADIKSSAAIADSKLATISTAGKVALTALEIDGGSDISADLADADLIIVDDGAGGTNRKAALSRVKTYIGDPTALAIALG